MVFLMSKRFVYEEESTIIHFTDHVSAFNGLKRSDIPNKGKLNNGISALLFEHLQKEGIPTQYLERIDESSHRVKVVTMVPLELIIRNKAAGPWVESLGLTHGQVFADPIIEYRLKKKGLKDPLINSTHIKALKLCSESDLDYIRDLCLKINESLLNLFKRIDIDMIDLKLEFGYLDNGDIVLADSITPDTMRLWDMNTLDVLDKDVFRRDLGKLETAYGVVLSRLESL